MIKYPELLLFRLIKIGLINIDIRAPTMLFVTPIIIFSTIRYSHFIILFVLVDLFEILIQFFSQL